MLIVDPLRRQKDGIEQADLHQPGEHWKHGQKGKDAEEHQHPNPHAFLIFSSFSYFLMQSASLQTRSSAFGEISIHKHDNACEKECVPALWKLWHVLDFLLHG